MTSPRSIDPDDLEPTIDLSLSQQKRILLLLVTVKGANHYEVLGVARNADKSEIKKAYFSLMNEFHEDRYYGKDLGGFAPRMRTLVEKFTRASNVLGRNKTRCTYDETLGGEDRNSGIHQTLKGSVTQSTDPPHPSSARKVEDSGPPQSSPQIPHAPRTPAGLGERLSAQGDIAIDEISGDSNGQPAPTSTLSPRKSRSESIKRNLARKMRRPSRPPPPSVDPQSIRQAVARDMKSRYDAQKTAGQSQILKYVRMSEEAQKSGDWKSAVNAIQIALELAPDDEKIVLIASEVQGLAEKALAPRYLEQAKGEEKDARFDQAARSYERAARGKNSPSLFVRSAECLLKTDALSQDAYKKVVELARQAVALDNDSATYRLTLARAYDAAGMKSSALAEVGRALSLEPDNNDAKLLQKSLK